MSCWTPMGWLYKYSIVQSFCYTFFRPVYVTVTLSKVLYTFKIIKKLLSNSYSQIHSLYVTLSSYIVTNHTCIYADNRSMTLSHVTQTIPQSVRHIITHMTVQWACLRPGGVGSPGSIAPVGRPVDQESFPKDWQRSLCRQGPHLPGFRIV
jgi:hypothetical protein